MNNTIKTFVISARKVKVNNKSFISCSTKIGDTFYKVKFRKDCEKAPKKPCLYDITVDIDKCSIQNGKKYITKDGYEAIGNHTIWVSEVMELREYTDEEMSEINRAKFDGVFAE